MAIKSRTHEDRLAVAKTIDLPPLFVSGLRSLDSLLIRARADKPKNRAANAYGAAYRRALDLNEIATIAANEIGQRDGRIKELEAEVAKLTELAGGEEAVTTITELQEDLDETTERITELETEAQGHEDATVDSWNLANKINRFLGPEQLDESVELYEVRRLIDDIL